RRTTRSAGAIDRRLPGTVNVMTTRRNAAKSTSRAVSPCLEPAISRRASGRRGFDRRPASRQGRVMPVVRVPSWAAAGSRSRPDDTAAADPRFRRILRPDVASLAWEPGRGRTGGWKEGGGDMRYGGVPFVVHWTDSEAGVEEAQGVRASAIGEWHR